MRRVSGGLKTSEDPVRHAPLALMLPLCAATLAAVVVLAFLTVRQNSKIDTFLERAPQLTAMPGIPDQTILETSWCYKTGEEPDELHTKVTVTTAQQPPETPAEHLARHLARIAEQQETTPNNCNEHSYP